MDYNEVRAEIIRQEADRMLLNFPPDPPIVDNPTWGAPPIQPTVREIRHTGERVRQVRCSDPRARDAGHFAVCGEFGCIVVWLNMSMSERQRCTCKEKRQQ